MRVGEMMERLPPGFGFTSRRRTGSLEAAVEGLGLVTPAAEVLVPEVAAGGTMYRRPLPLPRPLPRCPINLRLYLKPRSVFNMLIDKAGTCQQSHNFTSRIASEDNNMA
jgi:hypothetical protein